FLLRFLSLPRSAKGEICADGSKDPPLQKLSHHRTAAQCSWETRRVARTRIKRARQRVCLRGDAFAAFALRLALLAEPLRRREEGRTEVRPYMLRLSPGLSAGRHP